MKIVGIDNYNRDTVSDCLHSCCLDEKEAKQRAKELNDKSGPHPSTYYVVKPDDYVLYTWEP